MRLMQKVASSSVHNYIKVKTANLEQKMLIKTSVTELGSIN